MSFVLHTAAEPQYYFGGYNKKRSKAITLVTCEKYARVYTKKEDAEKAAKVLSKSGYTFIAKEKTTI